jgi:hypothetical protein
VEQERGAESQALEGLTMLPMSLLRTAAVPRVGMLLCLLAFLTLPGCATNREGAAVSPDVDLSHLQRFYVVKFAPD